MEGLDFFCMEVSFLVQLGVLILEEGCSVIS